MPKLPRIIVCVSSSFSNNDWRFSSSFRRVIGVDICKIYIYIACSCKPEQFHVAVSRSNLTVDAQAHGCHAVVAEDGTKAEASRHSSAVHPAHANEKVSAADTLLLLIFNLAAGRLPLYELPQWTGKLMAGCLQA